VNFLQILKEKLQKGEMIMANNNNER